MSIFTPMQKLLENWHTKYNSDFETVHEQLANKVNIKGEVITPEQYNNMNDFPTGYVRASGKFLNSPPTTENLFNGEVLTLRYPDYVTQKATHILNAQEVIHQRQWGSGIWHQWYRLATAEPPQEYELPLVVGYTSGNAKYFILQNRVVHISGYISSIDNVFSFEQVLGTLPVGYRPKEVVHSPSVAHPPIVAGLIHVHPDGNILLRVDNVTSQKAVYFSFSFLSAQ